LLAGQLSIYFRAKFLQSEAKLALLTLYTAEKSLKDEAKPSSYSYDLSRVLKHVKPLEKYHYVFGFMKGCGKKFVRSRRAHVHSQDLYPRSYRHLGSRTTANIISFFSKRGAENDCYDPKIGYEAYAVRSLDPLNPTRLDVWKIDQDKRIENVVDGLPLP